MDRRFTSHAVDWGMIRSGAKPMTLSIHSFLALLSYLFQSPWFNFAAVTTLSVLLHLIVTATSPVPRLLEASMHKWWAEFRIPQSLELEDSLIINQVGSNSALTQIFPYAVVVMSFLSAPSTR